MNAPDQGWPIRAPEFDVITYVDMCGCSMQKMKNEDPPPCDEKGHFLNVPILEERTMPPTQPNGDVEPVWEEGRWVIRCKACGRGSVSVADSNQTEELKQRVIEMSYATQCRCITEGPDFEGGLSGISRTESLRPSRAFEPGTVGSMLEDWWMNKAQEEIVATVPKAIEYGSHDLLEIGRTMAYVMGRKVNDQEATELGIFFYSVGKMARWASAIAEGRRASDDTLFDQGIYIRMAQRNRDAGGWPSS